MLSYFIPVEGREHLQLNLDIQKQHLPPRTGSAVNGVTSKERMAPTAVHNFINLEQQTNGGLANGGTKKIIKVPSGKVNGTGPAISTESSASSLSSKASDATTSGASQGGVATPTSGDKLKPKLVQNGGTKTTSLKRVSFGSSKGSMVETLIYETPLQEEQEVATPTGEISSQPPPAEVDSSSSDSKKVRVSFFESERPLVVNSPEPGDIIFDILDAPVMMSSVSPNGFQAPQYQRQASTDSGWDNPFRPDGDLSREADEIVGLIKEGKPITPTSFNGVLKGSPGIDERDAVAAQSKSQLSAVASSTPKKGFGGGSSVGGVGGGAGGGSNGAANCDKAGVVDVQRTVVSPSGGGDVEPVVIKKKPKCKCCVIQ